MSVADGRTADMRIPHSDLPAQDPQHWSPAPGQPPPPRLPWEPDWRRRPLPDAVAVRRCPVPAWAPPFDSPVPPARASSDQPVPGSVVPGPAGRQPRATQGTPAPTGPTPGSPETPRSAAESGAAGRGAVRPGTARPEAPGHGAAKRSGTGVAPGGPQIGRRPGPPPREGEWVGQWPSQFAQVLAETLAGSRPAQQVRPWTTEQARKRIRQLGPVLQASQRPRVRRVLTSQPRPGVVEMAVIVGIGPRTRAIAVRLERGGPGGVAPDRAGRARPAREPESWICTAIEAA
jgi:hypothetical protein